MKKIIMILMVAAFALPTMAQNYTLPEQQAQAPTFQSTSTMAGSGSALASQPTLNADGTASTPTRVGGGPKKVLPNMPTTEGEQGNTPLGDAVLPLMLCAMLLAGVIYLRRRKRA